MKIILLLIVANTCYSSLALPTDQGIEETQKTTTILLTPIAPQSIPTTTLSTTLNSQEVDEGELNADAVVIDVSKLNITENAEFHKQLLEILNKQPLIMVYLFAGMLSSMVLNVLIYFVLPYIPCIRRAQFQPYWRKAQEMAMLSNQPI